MNRSIIVAGVIALVLPLVACESEPEQTGGNRLKVQLGDKQTVCYRQIDHNTGRATRFPSSTASCSVKMRKTRAKDEYGRGILHPLRDKHSSAGRKGQRNSQAG